MTWISVDVESDGPIPGVYSMVCFGAVVVEEGLDRTFYGQCAPDSCLHIPEALKVSGFSRQEHMKFPSAVDTMKEFRAWLENIGPDVRFVSDNNGYDFMWIAYYLWRFAGGNPFKHTSTNMNSLFKGWKKSTKANYKRFRRKVATTRHTHHPVDDAKGNAEALLEMKKQGLIIDL